MWHEKFPKEPWIEGYTDGYATTATVGSFAPNNHGIYDLGGNVWEWCEDLYEPGRSKRVLRGPSWNTYGREFLLSSSRIDDMPSVRTIHSGFRCVLAPAISIPPAAGAKETPAPAGVGQTPAPATKSPGGVLTFPSFPSS